MSRALHIEYRKMRRLRTVPILAVMVAVVVALSSITLFSASTQAKFADPAAMPWAGLLMSYTAMAAMTSPILISVLASRHTDIEHTGGGWFLAQAAGFTPGTILRAKWCTLALLVTITVTVQTALLIAVGGAAGIRVPLDAAQWAGYTAGLILIDLAFLAAHLWFAAVVENQLISVGLGMLGSFAAVFLLLIPPVYARLLPWGYYAMISQVAAQNRAIISVTPPWAWIAVFLLLVAAGFVLATRRLDRVGR